MVKRVGFEPTIPLTVYKLSKCAQKPEAGYMKKLFLIDPYQRKIPTDSGT